MTRNRYAQGRHKTISARDQLYSCVSSARSSGAISRWISLPPNRSSSSTTTGSSSGVTRVIRAELPASRCSPTSRKRVVEEAAVANQAFGGVVARRIGRRAGLVAERSGEGVDQPGRRTGGHSRHLADDVAMVLGLPETDLAVGRLLDDGDVAQLDGLQAPVQRLQRLLDLFRLVRGVETRTRSTASLAT